MLAAPPSALEQVDRAAEQVQRAHQQQEAPAERVTPVVLVAERACQRSVHADG